MREVLDDMEYWRRGGHDVVVARVVSVIGSGLRASGATMVVSAGEAAGSVSGRCAESAVVTEAPNVRSTRSQRPCAFDYFDNEAFAAGLAGSGTAAHPRDQTAPIHHSVG